MDLLTRFSSGITLKQSWGISFDGQKVEFFGSHYFSWTNPTPTEIIALKAIAVGAQLQELEQILPDTELKKLIYYLDANNVIRPMYKNDFVGTRFEKQVEFFSEFVDDPNAAQQRLLEAKVCIVGCGGTGNIIVEHLVSAGVRKYTLIDGDNVELSNFNRQFCFNNVDLGRPKVEALKDYILAKDKESEVITYQTKINSCQDLEHLLAQSIPDILICCADTPPIAIHTYILEYCSDREITCAFGAVGIHNGHFGPLLKQRKQIQNCLVKKQEQLKGREEVESSLIQGGKIISASISYLNTIIATSIAEAIIVSIAETKEPFILNSMWRYDDRYKTIYKTEDY